MAQQQQQQYPVSVYQRQLMNVQPVNTGGGSWQNVGQSGLKLAKTLGVLSDMSYQRIINDRQQKIDENKKAAATAISKATLEELKTRDVTDLLTKYGVISLADNPWAIAEADKIKAASLAAEARAGYDVYKLEHQIAPAKNADEEAKQFSDYMQEKFSEYTKDTGYTKAFQDSFFENFTNDQIQVAQSRHAEISKEIEARLLGNLKKELNTSLNHYYNQGTGMKIQEVKEHIQKLFDSSPYQALNLNVRVPLLNEALNDVAQNLGSPELLKALTGVVVDTDPITGESVTWDMLTDFQPYMTVARSKAAQNYDYHNYQLYEEFLKITDRKEFFKRLESLKGTSDYEFINSRVEQIFNEQDRIKAAEEKEKMWQLSQERNANALEEIQPYIDAEIFNHLNAFLQGSSSLNDGRTIANSIGEFKEIPYQTIDAQGHIITKKYKITNEDVDRCVRGKISSIMTSSALKPKDKLRKVADVLRWGASRQVKQAMQQEMETCLFDINVDAIDKKTGLIKPTEQINMQISLYNADPARFRFIYGDKAANAFNLINALSMQSRAIGLTRYAKTKDLLRSNPDLLTTTKSKVVSNSLSHYHKMQFYNLNNQLVRAPFVIESDPVIKNQVDTNVAFLIMSGLSEELAYEQVGKEMQRGFRYWRNTFIPASLIAVIDSSVGKGTAVAGLEACLSKAHNTFGLQSGIPIQTKWDSQRECLTFSSGGNVLSFSIHDISNNGKYVLNHNKKKQSKKKNYTYEQYNKQTQRDYSYHELQKIW